MPREVREQVIVLLGASSGIGRETALEFAQCGAKLVLAARNEAGLRSLAQEVERLGGIAEVVITDVAEWPQVERLARRAVERFGRIDTWVNLAAASEYATIEQMTVEEIERQTQVIFMGQVHGIKAVLPHMRKQGQGTIICVASALAVRSVPLQGAYCAAKHAIRGFVESLRMELAHERSGIAVSLIMPSSINTPFFANARSKLGVKPQPLPPIYEPRVVAETIVFAAAHPRREIVVGGAGKMLTVLERISPALLDWYMLRNGRAFKQQRTDQPDDGRDNLYAPIADNATVTGEFGGRSKSTSLYTRHLEQYPNRKRALLGAMALGAFALMRRVGR